LAFIYTVYALALFVLQRDLLFPRYAAKRRPGALVGLMNVEPIERPIPGGIQEALFMPATKTDGSPSPAVIFAHGNGETIEDWPWPLEAYRRLGVSVLIPEYRGYGRTAGLPSEDAIVSDFVAQYDRLAARPDVDPRRIFFHGRSIGGGVAAALAAQRRPAALILQSTFTSVRALAHRRLLPGFLVRDPFDSLSVVRSLDAPLFVAHGTRDFLIPFSEGEALAQAAMNAEFHSMDCTHADCPPDWEAFMADVEKFLRRERIVR
jgi:hypothetical protein